MKNIRPKYNAAQSTKSARVTPVNTASRGTKCSATNGIEETRLMQSSGRAAASGGAGRSRTVEGAIASQPTDQSVGKRTPTSLGEGRLTFVTSTTRATGPGGSRELDRPHRGAGGP